MSSPKSILRCAFYLAIACAGFISSTGGVKAQGSFTNSLANSTGTFYWNGEGYTLRERTNAWTGFTGSAQVSGEFLQPGGMHCYAWLNIGTNGAPVSVGSTNVANPEVAIRAHAESYLTQKSDPDWNGYGDWASSCESQIADLYSGVCGVGKGYWRMNDDHSQGPRDYAGMTIANHTSILFLNMDDSGLSITDYFTLSNRYLFNYYYDPSPRFGYTTGDFLKNTIATNYLVSTLNVGGNSTNAWHYELDGLAADTIFELFSGNRAGSSTNTLVLEVQVLDNLQAGYMNSSRISVLVNGNTYPLDTTGKCVVSLPNDTKTPLKVLIAPDASGVINAKVDIFPTYQ